MIELLQLAIEAHGGMETWEKLQSATVPASITGAIWYVKGQGDVLRNVVMDLDLHREKMVMLFPGTDKKTCFEAELITINDYDGNPSKAFPHPLSSFEGHQRDTPWEDVHVAYFSGEALWTYLTTPFLYSYPGFETEELTPWLENGEIWRRLKVTFPDYVASHSKEQISYFGPDGLLRRHDYTVDILGGATGANYASNYCLFDGIVVPTTRTIYAYEGVDHAVQKDLVLVSVTMGYIHFF